MGRGDLLFFKKVAWLGVEETPESDLAGVEETAASDSISGQQAKAPHREDPGVGEKGPLAL